MNQTHVPDVTPQLAAELELELEPSRGVAVREATLDLGRPPLSSRSNTRSPGIVFFFFLSPTSIF